MNQIKVAACSALWSADGLYLLAREATDLSLLLLDGSGNPRELTRFQGRKGSILDAHGSRLLICVDSQLLEIDEGSQRLMANAHHPDNFFWHATRTPSEILVQEYGTAPTGIWSVNRSAQCLVLNTDLDKHSRHFHSVCYDSYRSKILATLGDGNKVRVVVSDDGRAWRPLYAGPWQFVPILPLPERIVFGFDSGIVSGGIAVFHPSREEWEFIFLKWTRGDYRGLCQIADLKAIDDFYVAAFGCPQVFAVSRNLKDWYELHRDALDGSFNCMMSVQLGQNSVALSGGSTVTILDVAELSGICDSKQGHILSSYGAYLARLKGWGVARKNSFTRERTHGFEVALEAGTS